MERIFGFQEQKKLIGSQIYRLISFIFKEVIFLESAVRRYLFKVFEYLRDSLQKQAQNLKV